MEKGKIDSIGAFEAGMQPWHQATSTFPDHGTPRE